MGFIGLTGLRLETPVGPPQTRLTRISCVFSCFSCRKDLVRVAVVDLRIVEDAVLDAVRRRRRGDGEERGRSSARARS